MDRIILHYDLNYFYANVEMLYHPETRDLPIAVGGDAEKRHGIILAKNPLAKSFGIKTGEALWQAKKKCPNLLIYPATTDKYSKFSKKVKRISMDYSDKIESFGIDEAWLDITHTAHLFGTPLHLAFILKERIKRELGVTISIGISYNKVFAKLASEYGGVDTITLINRKNKGELIDPLDVGKLLFIGRKTVIKLNTLNINTIGDLALASPQLLLKHFGKVGTAMYLYANGLDESDVISEDRVPKSVGNSSTTVNDMFTYQDIYLVLSVLSQSVATRLKKQNLKGRCLTLNIRTKDLVWSSFQTTLSEHTNLYSDIIKTAFALLQKHYRLETPLRSIGVSLNQLIKDASMQQLSLFEQKEKDRSFTLENTIDEIRNRFGYSTVDYAILKLNEKLTDFAPSTEQFVFPSGNKS